jgi:magnesium transporter
VQFEITDNFLSQFRKAIDAENAELVLKQLVELHPADIAEIFKELKIREALYAYSQLQEQVASDVLVELDDDIREQILASFTPKEIAESVDNMDSDDATDVIAELPDKVQDEVLSHIEDSEQASDIVELLNYDEDTAGSIMATELIKLNANSSTAECIEEIRNQAEEIENIYTIYLVDDNEKLVGLASLQQIVIAPTNSKVADILDHKTISVTTNIDVEEVANIMDKYDLIVMPVVDSIGKLVGRITIDDIIDVRREEETEDVQKMAGVEAFDEPYMSMSILEVLKKRVGWLVILFLGETLTASAMSLFEDEITKVVILALFVPLIISSGGNTGSQASTLIVRAMALGEVTLKNWLTIISREFKVGVVLGVILGIIGFLRVVVWAQFTNFYGDHYFDIGLVIGFSLMGVVLWGNVIGSLFPLILKKLGFDPAVSSAPFVATFVDVTGLLIYFTAASILLKEILV